MIWTIAPSSPWRITAAALPRPAVSAECREDEGTAPDTFLDQIEPDDRSLVEMSLRDAARTGSARCTCRLARRCGENPSTPALIGLLDLSLLSSTSHDSAPATLVARWTVTTGEPRVVDDRSMRQFLGEISHDLRTPLNGVLGMSRLLLDSGLRGDQVDYARTIDASAEQLLSVIEDLLEFATLDTKTALHPVDVDPRALVSDEISSLTSRAAEREIEICALISANVPDVVVMDEERVRQVLGYALQDGVERAGVGDVILRVGFDGARLRFDVSADEPAWAEVSRTRVARGSSAGAATFGAGADASPRAAVCRHLVSIMDGVLDRQIDAHGGVAQGFSVRVTPRPAAPRARPLSFASLAGRRVLCVDDQAVSRLVLIERLRGWQIAAEVADEAHAALTMMKVASAAGAPFDLIVIDLRLPGVDGITLARLIKADPLLARTKLVLLTGYPARGQAEMAIEAGIDAYLQKPVREAPLRACLDALLNGDAPVAQGREGVGAHAWRLNDDKARNALRPRVLVAEDHPLNQKVTVQLLDKLGCRVDVVATGEEAVAAVTRTPYHLVLMDSRLSSLDGAGATRAIRQLPEPAALTPIVALAREDDEPARQAALAAGVNDVMPKPPRLGTLREKLAQWIASAPNG